MLFYENLSFLSNFFEHADTKKNHVENSKLVIEEDKKKKKQLSNLNK